MGPDAASRRSIGESVELVATNLLFVLVVLLVLRQLVGLSLPFDPETFALVVAGSFVVAAVVRPSSCSADGEDDDVNWTSRTVVFVLLGLCTAGAVLRLYALGEASFWFDEAITTNAAIGFLEHGRPRFPSGVVYWRGFPHTILVAASMAVFGVSEWAARLPAVVFGVATIPVVYVLGRELGNRRVGLVAAVLVTFLTWEITWSRQARMYQQLQFFYALALVGLARIDRTGLVDARTLGLVGGGTILAAWTHKIGLVLVLVSIAYLATHLWRGGDGWVSDQLGRSQGGRDPVGQNGDGPDRRGHNWRRRGAWGPIVVVVAIGAILELVGTGPVTVARTVLATDVVHFERYRAWVSAEFGILYYLALVGFGVSFRRIRRGLLLALAVVPPVWVLAFHTRLFATRYVYFAVPIAVVFVGLVVDVGVARTREIVRSSVDWRSDANPFRRRLASLTRDDVPTVLTAVVVVLLVSPALTVVPQAGYAVGPNTPQSDFASAYEFVDANERPGDVLVAGWTAPALYYHGRVDYWLVHNLSGASRDWTAADGREVYSGATPVSRPSELRDVVDCTRRGWIVLDRVVTGRMDPDMRAVVTNLTAHETGADDVNVYSWRGTDQCPEAAIEPTDPAGTDAYMGELRSLPP